MKATLEIKFCTLTIPLFIEILEWLEECPVKELEIQVCTIWLNKEVKKSE